MAVFEDLDDFNPQDQDILKNLAQSGAMLSFDEVQVGMRGNNNPFANTFPFSANDGTSTLPYVDKYVSQTVDMKSFSGIDKKEIERDYFVNAKAKTEENIRIVKELECETDITPTILDLYINRDGVKGYDPDGKDEYLAKIYVYISKNGSKISHLYECSENGLKEDEIYFFLEDNTGDYSDQVLYARFGSEKIKRRLLQADDKYLQEISSLVPDFNNDLLKELILNGKVEARSFILQAILTGGLLIGKIVFAIPKAVGWLFTQIGDIIADNLKIPQKIWDSHSEDYFLKKENLIKDLQIDTSFLNAIDAIVGNNNSIKLITFFPIGQKIISSQVQLAKHLTDQYNSFVERVVDYTYEIFEEAAGKTDNIFHVSEVFAFFCGLWNGLVDFIADIFKFIGLLLEGLFDILNNFQSFLESLDNLIDALKNFSVLDIFMSITFVQTYVSSELIKFFKSDNKQEEYNLDKIAYYTGYGVGFIVTLFIPFLDLANIAKAFKVSYVSKAVRGVPDEYLKAIGNKSGEVPQTQGQLIKLLNDLAEFLGKKVKGKTFNDEIKKVLDDAVEYFKNNKDFENNLKKIPNLTKSDLDWMASRRIGNLGGNVLKASQIRKLRSILKKKGIQLIVEGDAKNITKLFKPIGNFKIFDDFMKFMYSFNPPKVGGFHAPTKQFFMTKNSTELVAFHEMAHVKHFEEVGEVTYRALKDLDKEMYVWEQILANRSKWTKAELDDSLKYINRLRERYNLEPIKIK